MKPKYMIVMVSPTHAEIYKGKKKVGTFKGPWAKADAELLMSQWVADDQWLAANRD